MVFIDFEKSYDKILKEIICCVLEKKWVSSRHINV